MADIRDIKRDRFVRVVEKRMEKLLEAFDSLGRCSNKSNYEYSKNDVKEIFKEVARKVREIKILYDMSAKEKKRFRLKK